MDSIVINNAPPIYQKYLRMADDHLKAKGKYDYEGVPDDGVIYGGGEALEAADHFCAANTAADCREFLKFLMQSGYRFKEIEMKFSGAGVGSLIEALNDENEDVRTETALALGNLIKQDISPDLKSKTIEPFLKALGDNNDAVRGYSATAIGELAVSKISPDLKNMTVDPLISALRDKNEHVRAQAAAALGGLARSDIASEIKARMAAPLIDALGDKSKNVRLQAVAALEDLAQSNIHRDSRAKMVNPLVRMLGDENDSVREKTVSALDKLAHAEILSDLKATMAEPLIKALNDRELFRYPSTRAKAAMAMSGLARSNIPAEIKIKMIDPLLEDVCAEHMSQPEIAMAVEGLALSDIPIDLKARMFDRIVDKAFRSENRGIREQAAYILKQINQPDPLNLPPEIKARMAGAFVLAMDPVNIQKRQLALIILQNVTSTPELEVRKTEYFISDLGNADQSVRSDAIKQLTMRAAEKIVSFSYSTPADRSSRYENVMSIFDILIGAAGNDDPYIRSGAIWILGDLADHPSIPRELQERVIALIYKTCDDRSFAGEQANRALEKLAQSKIPLILRSGVVDFYAGRLHNENDRVQNEADEILRKLAESTIEPHLKTKIVDSFIDAFGSNNENIRNKAASGLKALVQSMISPDLKAKIAGPVIDALGSADFATRWTAVFVVLPVLAISSVPPEIKARMVSPLIEMMMNDKSGDIQKAAVFILKDLAMSDISLPLKNKIAEALKKPLKNRFLLQK